MGCGSSTHQSVPVGQAATATSAHPNASLVVGSGLGSRRLTERPRRGSQTFGDAAAKEERERQAALLQDQRKRDLHEAATLMADAAAAAAADEEAAAFAVSADVYVTPRGSGLSSDEEPDSCSDERSDSSGAGDESDESDDEDEDSMQEIEEEAPERPVDDVDLLTPHSGPRTIGQAAPSTLRPRTLLQRGSSLQNLLQTFTEESMHVLVVDDDAAHLEAVGQWLSHKRYHVTLCNDGEEAVEVLSANFSLNSPSAATPTAPTPSMSDIFSASPPPPRAPSASASPTDFDLILADLSMESPEGTPLLDWVLRHEQTRRIPFVLMSSDFSSQSCDRSLRRGAEDFVSKPLQRHVLLKTLRAILEQRVEQRNSTALKEWGDKYKQQLMVEKTRTAAIIATATPIATPSNLHPRAQLSPYASQDQPSVAGASGTSPTLDPSLLPTPSPVLLPLTTPADPPLVVPHPHLISPALGPGRKLQHPLQISLPSDASATPLGTPLLAGLTEPQASPPDDERVSVVHEATVLLVDPCDDGDTSARAPLAQWLASINYTLICEPTMEAALTFLRKAAASRLQRSSTSFVAHDASLAPGSGSANKKHASPSTLQAPFSASLDRIGSITPQATPTARAAAAAIANANANGSHPTSASSAGTSTSPPIHPPSSFKGHAPRRSVTNFSALTSLSLGPGIILPQSGPGSGGSRKASAIESPPIHLPSGLGLAPRMLTPRLSAMASPSAPCDLIIADAEPSDGGSVDGGVREGMSGSAFIGAIQASAVTKSIPVILLYESGSGVDMAESIRQGVETVLVKPVSKEMLIKKVNQVLTTMAQKKKSAMYAERAQAYRSILSAFRAHRDEEVRQGKRGSPLQRRATMQGGTAPMMVSSPRSGPSSPLARKQSTPSTPAAGAAPPTSTTPMVKSSRATTPSPAPPLTLGPLARATPSPPLVAPVVAPPAAVVVADGTTSTRPPRSKRGSSAFTFDQVLPDDTPAASTPFVAITSALPTMVAPVVVSATATLPPPPTIEEKTSASDPSVPTPPRRPSGSHHPRKVSVSGLVLSSSSPVLTVYAGIGGSPARGPISISPAPGASSSGAASPAMGAVHRIQVRTSGTAAGLAKMKEALEAHATATTAMAASVSTPGASPTPAADLNHDGVGSLSRKGSARIKFVVHKDAPAAAAAH